MARFVFKLESVLRHRIQQERQMQRDLAVVQTQLAALESDLASMGVSTQASLDDLRKNHLVGRIDVSFLTAHRRYMLAMQRKSHAISAEIALVNQRVTTARTALAQAAMNRKMLEKLREKQKQSWLESQAIKEFAEADDVGMRLAFADNTAARLAEESPEEIDSAEGRAQMQREDHA